MEDRAELPAGGSEPEDRLEVGTIVGGRYRLDARIGAGGMGMVWACTHLVLGERVAVKFVSSSAGLSKDTRERFIREARAAAKLNSRFTVRVFDTGEMPYGTPYIVMEYLEGETLDEQLRREGRLTMADAARILVQVARGLAQAHDAGIVHRDIKPDNIFLAKTMDDGIVAKIFDFGVAKVSGGIGLLEATETGLFLGTPQFMSPEQALAARDVDHRADIYSLGVVAHRMLTGQRLYHAESFAGVLMEICGSPLPKLGDALPQTSPDLEAWFQRACAKDRNDRFASAVDCASAFVLAAGLSMPSGEYVLNAAEDSVARLRPRVGPPPELVAHRSGHRKMLGASVAVAIVVLVGGLVAFGVAPRREHRAATTPAPVANDQVPTDSLPPPASGARAGVVSSAAASGAIESGTPPSIVSTPVSASMSIASAVTAVSRPKPADDAHLEARRRMPASDGGPAPRAKKHDAPAAAPPANASTAIQDVGY